MAQNVGQSRGFWKKKLTQTENVRMDYGKTRLRNEYIQGF